MLVYQRVYVFKRPRWCLGFLPQYLRLWNSNGRSPFFVNRSIGESPLSQHPNCGCLCSGFFPGFPGPFEGHTHKNHPNGGFHIWRYTQNHVFSWDVPRKKPSSYWNFGAGCQHDFLWKPSNLHEKKLCSAQSSLQVAMRPVTTRDLFVVHLFLQLSHLLPAGLLELLLPRCKDWDQNWDCTKHNRDMWYI